MQVATKNIKKEETLHEIPSPRGNMCKGCFSNSTPIHQITWHVPLKPLNLLTINLKDESFHNSIEWSGLYFKWIFHHVWEHFLDLKRSAYWKMQFVKLFSPRYDLIISPPSRTVSKILIFWQGIAMTVHFWRTHNESTALCKCLII